MTKKKEISEKSLELNICSEMLQCLRSHTSLQKALWVGLTQREEREIGLDERLRNASGVALMLQFKSPWATSRVNDLYKFSINKDQHEALGRLGHPEAVFYVFPLYSKWLKADIHAPNLLQDTWLLPASCIPSSKLVQESTPIYLRRHADLHISVTGHPAGYPSREANCDAINAGEYLQMSEGQMADILPSLISISQLREWVDTLEGIVPRFRGLGFFYLPSDLTP